MSEQEIRNDETVPPGTLVRGARGHVVYEVIETRLRQRWLEGRLRDTRTGRSVGWRHLDTMVREDPGAHRHHDH